MGKSRPKRILIIGYPYFVDRLIELGQGSDLELSTMPKGLVRRLITLFPHQSGLSNRRPSRTKPVSSLAVLVR